jgi:crotonobetainyl-CoA:carnitine CoA-transferase CaiB-like acyl-CoA transferase
MAKWGLAYDDLKKLKPDIIMVSASMQGQTGPHSNDVGIGTQMMALAGFNEIVGWPDRAPVGMPNSHTDWIVPLYGIVAIIGALDYRGRTGKGLYIDLSQFEASLQFLSPAILDYIANSRIQGRVGNRCPYAAPHGAYRCKGYDRWCVIAIFDNDEWKAFCKVIGDPDWTREPRFSTLSARKRNEEELGKLVEQWTRGHLAEEVTEMMQKVGIASGVVKTGKDLHEDSQLRHRHHFWQLKHPEIGDITSNGPAFKLSKTPAELHMPGPCLGEHTEYVCTQILGMSDQEFVRLLGEGVFN